MLINKMNMYYFTDLGMPHEVVIFLLKSDVWDKYFNNGEVDTFRTIVLGKSKATKPKVEKTIQEILRMNPGNDSHRITEDDIYTKTLRNDSNFSVYILPEQDRVYYNSDYCVYIGITIDGLKIPYKLSTPIRSQNFIDLVSKCKYITNGNVHGKFIYLDQQTFFQYHPEDYNLLENIRRVNLLSDNRKTTTLQAGHIYIMKDKTKVLYLGDLKETKEGTNGRSWRIEDEHSFFTSNYDDMVYRNYYNQALYINLDTIDRRDYFHDLSLKEFILTQKGTKISEFIPKWLQFVESSGEDDSDILSYGCLTYGGGGIDEGEILVNDTPDLCDILGSISLGKLENILKTDSKDKNKISKYALSLGSEYIKSLPTETKNKIFNTVIKPDLDKMFKSISYRVRSDMYDKVIAENTSSKDLFNYIKSIGLYYIDILDRLVNQPTSFSSLLYSGRESELNTLIIESKKANFRK